MTNDLAVRILNGDVLGTTEQTHEAVAMAIKALSADAQPVRHGKWEKKWHSVFKGDLPCCSVCHSFNAFRWDYCPNCGARMDEGSE